MACLSGECLGLVHCVEVPPPCVPVRRISEYPLLHSPFIFLLREVLKKGEPTLEVDHTLVNGDVLGWCVAVSKATQEHAE